MGKKGNGERHQRRTRFELEAPGAEQVFVAGTFNDWRADATPLTRGRGGRWVADVDVSPGRHEYKFVVDGSWCCGVGPEGPTEDVQGTVPNDKGTMNRVLEVQG